MSHHGHHAQDAPQSQEHDHIEGEHVDAHAEGTEQASLKESPARPHR